MASRAHYTLQREMLLGVFRSKARSRKLVSFLGACVRRRESKLATSARERKRKRERRGREYTSKWSHAGARTSQIRHGSTCCLYILSCRLHSTVCIYTRGRARTPALSFCLQRADCVCRVCTAFRASRRRGRSKCDWRPCGATYILRAVWVYLCAR